MINFFQSFMILLACITALEAAPEADHLVRLLEYGQQYGLDVPALNAFCNSGGEGECDEALIQDIVCIIKECSLKMSADEFNAFAQENDAFFASLENDSLTKGTPQYNKLKINMLRAYNVQIDNNLTVGGNTTLNNLTVNGTISGNLSLITGSTSCNTANAIVERNSAGDFSATTITLDGTSLINYSTIGGCDTGSGFIWAPTNSGTIIGLSAGNPASTGTFNTAVGNNAFNSNTSGSLNTAIGAYALQPNTIGIENTAVGGNALGSNSTGNKNTAIGTNALVLNTSGSYNTALGQNTLSVNTTGSQNVAVGVDAMLNNASGFWNVAVGSSSLAANVGGSYNTAIGENALGANNSGNFNVALGENALSQFTTGSYNTGLGARAGFAYTGSESYNIVLGTIAVAGDQKATRIGYFSADSIQTSSCFIAGISGALASGGSEVFCSANGQLGTTTSSKRYKENIEDLGTTSEKIYQLRPVHFNYINDSEKWFETGFIAEEVLEVMPEIVVFKDGQPETVRYKHLPILMLNEQQKDHKLLLEMNKKIEDLERKINQLI